MVYICLRLTAVCIKIYIQLWKLGKQDKFPPKTQHNVNLTLDNVNAGSIDYFLNVLVYNKVVPGGSSTHCNFFSLISTLAFIRHLDIGTLLLNLKDWIVFSQFNITLPIPWHRHSVDVSGADIFLLTQPYRYRFLKNKEDYNYKN